MNKRVPPGTLTLIIERVKEKYSVPSTTNIQIEIILTRVMKRNLGLAQVAGNHSLLLEIEPYVFHMIDHLAKMRIPLNVRKASSMYTFLLLVEPWTFNKWRGNIRVDIK